MKPNEVSPEVAPVPDDWHESELGKPHSESGRGPEKREPWSSWNDPWLKYQPTTGSGGEREAKKPTREDFEAFCNWWSNHSSLESEETRSAPPEAGRRTEVRMRRRPKIRGGRRRTRRVEGTMAMDLRVLLMAMIQGEVKVEMTQLHLKIQ